MHPLLVLLLILEGATLFATKTALGDSDGISHAYEEWDPTAPPDIARVEGNKTVGKPLKLTVFQDGPALRMSLPLRLRGSGINSSYSKVRMLVDSGSGILATCPGIFETKQWMR